MQHRLHRLAHPSGRLLYLDTLLFSIAYLVVGIVAGFLGGMLGIGGGVVIVPALIVIFDAFDLVAHGAPGGNGTTLTAVGTSLASIIFTSAAAARVQIRAGMVEWSVVRGWTPFLIVGSYAAGFLAAMLSLELLRLLIGAFLLFVATVMLTSWKPAPHRALPGRLLGGLLSSIGGLISGVAGIGGGNVVVPTLVYHNVPVHRATATASTLGLPIALAGALGYIHRGWFDTQLSEGFLGYVYLPALAAIVLATVVTAPIGVRAAHRIAPVPLRRAFGVLLVIVSVRMFWSALGSQP
ncbi:MAG: sulfite exporter TauE/SafE family protein [Gammaproteobacteria bacterium]|nr:sulfite exporter TauE/SafE family protein [Gammaproteobacteria bacterium]